MGWCLIIRCVGKCFCECIKVCNDQRRCIRNDFLKMLLFSQNAPVYSVWKHLFNHSQHGNLKERFDERQRWCFWWGKFLKVKKYSGLRGLNQAALMMWRIAFCDLQQVAIMHLQNQKCCQLLLFCISETVGYS